MGFRIRAQELRIFTLLTRPPYTNRRLIKSLGLSLTEGRLRNRDWQLVITKIEARLGGWQARLLSCSGRLVLLQSLLVAIPIYFLAIFRIPEGVRRQIESIMRRFFWQGTRPFETRGVALVAWRTVLPSKISWDPAS